MIIMGIYQITACKILCVSKVNVPTNKHSVNEGEFIKKYARNDEYKLNFQRCFQISDIKCEIEDFVQMHETTCTVEQVANSAYSIIYTVLPIRHYSWLGKHRYRKRPKPSTEEMVW